MEVSLSAPSLGFWIRPFSQLVEAPHSRVSLGFDPLADQPVPLLRVLIGAVLGIAAGTYMSASARGLWGPSPRFHPLAWLPEIVKCQAGPFMVIPPLLPTVYFRALVNFTRSIEYSPQLEDASSEAFREVSEAVVDTVR